MPFNLSLEIDPTKLTALAAIPRPRVGEIVRVEWAGGNDPRFYAMKDYNAITGFSGLAGYGIEDIEVRFKKAQFIDIPRGSDISDDKINLEFVDYDQDVTELYVNSYGEGSRVTVFEWFPEVDLLMEVFWGHLESPDEMDGLLFKIKASTGFRSPLLSLPHRTMYPGCQALFGGHVRQDGSFLFPTLAAVAENDCRYNRHVGGLIGTDGFTSCPRNNVSVCTARGMTPYYLAFDFFSGLTSSVGFDHKWTATTRGNDSNQNKALRVVAGTRRIKQLDLQGFQAQSGGNNPQAGYLVTLFAVCEGPIVQAYNFYVNDQYIALNHQISNRGEVGQVKVPFPTTTLNYSGTALARLDAGPKDWRGITADQINAECTVIGSNDVRVYSDADTYTKQYTTNRAWWLLHVLTNKRWGYGLDHSRIVVQDWIDLASWCDDTVATTDVDGETPLSSTRSTFNADLNERPTQQQITDICLGGRFGLPFNYNGKLRCIPLANAPESGTPVFTDQGADRNIVFENGRSTLRWSRKSDKDIVNQLKVTFDDAAYNWEPHKLILDDLDQQLKAGIASGDRTLRVVSKEVNAFGITNYGEAVRWSKLLLNLGEFDGFDKPGIKNNLRVKFVTWAPLVAALKLYPYRTIVVVNTRLQSKWEEEPGMPITQFRIMKMRRLKDQKMEIEAQAYPANYYGNTELDTYSASSGTPNPGGDRTALPHPVRPRIVRRTVDYILVDSVQD